MSKQQISRLKELEDKIQKCLIFGKYNLEDYCNFLNSIPDLLSGKGTLGLLISGMLQFGALIYGFGLLLIVWIEYFLISFIIKLCNKLQGVKKFFSVLVLSIISAILLIIFIRIITFIFFLFIG